MRVDKIRTLPGPNIYTHNPVLVMTLYLEDLTDKESFEIPGFVDRLLKTLPGLYEHRCSRERRGGFVERLHEGTYFAHIVEHMALELSELAGVPLHFGCARYAGERGRYFVIVEHKAEQAMRHLLNVAVELVSALVIGDPFPLEEKLQEAHTIAGRTELGPSTRAIVEAAERAIQRMGAGDIVVIFYDQIEPIREVLAAHQIDGLKCVKGRKNICLKTYRLKRATLLSCLKSDSPKSLSELSPDF